MGWKDWQGILIIGGGALVLGVVLLVPALWWARRARKDPGAPSAQKVPGSTLAGVFAVVAFLLVALSTPIWAPHTGFGQWMSNDQGRLTFAAAAFAAVFVLSYMAAICALVLRAGFYTRSQKAMQCGLVLLLPLLGAILAHWVYLLHHAEAAKIDRAFIAQQDQADIDTVRHHHRGAEEE